MSDNIEQNEDGTLATFVSLREPAWHNLGTVIEEQVDTAEMLRLAHMDNWDIRLEEVTFPEGYQSHKSFYSVVRNNPFTAGQTDVLGVVGERFRVLQNEQLFEFGDAILSEFPNARWETAGSVKNGTQVFGALALDMSVTLDKDGVADKVDNYLLVSTGHDGSASVSARITPVRVVCSNTLAMAMRQTSASFTLRHSQTIEGRVNEARNALNLASRYVTEWQNEMDALIQAEMSRDDFDTLITVAYPMPDEDVRGSMAKWETKRESLFDLLDSPTNRDIAGTYWGGLNALNERLMWMRNVRAGKAEGLLLGASGMDTATNAENQRLFGIVREMANVTA